MAADKKHMQLPEGVTLENLQDNWNMANTEHQVAFRRMRLLDAADRGKLWDLLKAGFPRYQLLPDTNHVSYVKNNLMASIYTVGKSAQLIPTSPDDKDTITHLNMAVEHYWDLAEIGYLQMLAGERAALTNMGIIQVGWDQNITGGTGDYAYKGAPAFKVIDPAKFMRDPYATTLETSAYCMTYETVHKNVLKANPLYRDSIEAAIAKASSNTSSIPIELNHDRPSESTSSGRRDYFRLIIHWVRIGDKYHEIHTLDNQAVLYVIEDMKPSAFPFALLYCNPPSGDLVGTSECAKIFANSVAYNIMNSVLLTADYRNQRPPKFVSNASGINLPSFIAHGNDSDYTFCVNGDASKAVHYASFPSPSQNAPTIMSMLNTDIQRTSGVDGRYTGRDTGSILTTGGVEAMINQATLVDAPKVTLYEHFTKVLTQLIIGNLLEYAPKRKYFIHDKNKNRDVSIEINFPALDKDTLFQYSVNVSSELPKNKARIAQMANTLMEKQMQYAASGSGDGVDYITPEEWLLCQDLPMRELMQDRMGIQRNADYMEQVSQTIFQFADLTSRGMKGEDAMAAIAGDLQQRNNPASSMPEGFMPDPNASIQQQQPPMTNPSPSMLTMPQQ